MLTLIAITVNVLAVHNNVNPVTLILYYDTFTIYPLAKKVFQIMSRFFQFGEQFRSKVPYALLLVGVVPGYCYIFSDKNKMRQEWKAEKAKKKEVQYDASDLFFQ